ncbi:uncharacterized protein LOC118197351 [Stegodyphus dumicola]|uniref:uncharacterized protein LOC118197351 n=1 Tax=Stegodyphus dumicola TaxID=202533 RepID=UPI0015ABBF43|nr:uncharacterized protein LOC118197351 [Stegodyphus dumicola]
MFVPHYLSGEQKQQRLDSCGDFINATDKDDTFLQSIVKGDKCGILCMIHKMKCQSMEYRSPSSPKSRKFRFEKSKVKTMLITFFDAQEIIHKEYQTVNGEFYYHVMKHLLARIRDVRPHLAASGRWFLLHDNARPHTAICVKTVPRTAKVFTCDV